MSWVERNRLILLVVIFCAGFFLRFYDLGGESFWLDEMMSLRYSQADLVSIFSPPRIEAQVLPLYYFLLHFWIGLFGTSEFAVRSLSAVFGCLSIFALYKLGKYLFNVKVAIYSSFILAFSIFHIYYSQEARMYSLLTLTTLVSIFFFVKSLDENRFRYWVGYIIVTILMLYTHFYGVFIVVFQFFYLLFYYRKKIGYAKNCYLAFFLVFLGFCPWLIKLFEITPYILQGSIAMTWIPNPNIILILGTIVILCNSSLVGLVVFGYSIKNVFQLDSMKKKFSRSIFFESLKRVKNCFLDSSKFSINFCLFWIGIPIILSLIISLILRPIYVARYFILVSPAVYLLVSKGLTKIKKVKIRYILVLILLIDSALIAYSYYTRFNKEQWREAANTIQQREETGDLIIINAPYLDLNFKHYYNGSNPIRGVQTVDQLNETLHTVEHNKLWLILSHDTIADPHGQVKEGLDNTYQLNWENKLVSQDILNNISILGYPIITENSFKILIYYYSK